MANRAKYATLAVVRFVSDCRRVPRGDFRLHLKSALTLFSGKFSK